MNKTNELLLRKALELACNDLIPYKKVKSHLSNPVDKLVRHYLIEANESLNLT